MRLIIEGEAERELLALAKERRTTPDDIVSEALGLYARIVDNANRGGRLIFQRADAEIEVETRVPGPKLMPRAPDVPESIRRLMIGLAFIGGSCFVLVLSLFFWILRGSP